MDEFRERLSYSTSNVAVNMIEMCLGNTKDEVISNFVNHVLDKKQLLFLNEFTYQLISGLSATEFNDEMDIILNKCFKEYLKFNLNVNVNSSHLLEIKRDGLPGEIFVSNMISGEARYINIIPKIAKNYKKSGFTGIDVVANDDESYIFAEVKYAKTRSACYGGLKEDLEKIITKKLKEELELIYDNRLHNKNGFTFKRIKIDESDTIQFADIINEKIDKNIKIILWGITEKRFIDSMHYKDLKNLMEYLIEITTEYKELEGKLSIFYIHVPIFSKEEITTALLQKLRGI